MKAPAADFARWCDRIRFGPEGLVPVAVEDARSGGLLMLAYADRAALEATWQTGRAWFFSRRRREPWEKGATSGHRMQVVGLDADCDRDGVRYRVVPGGPACHTGARSCFFEEAPPPRTETTPRGEGVTAAPDGGSPPGTGPGPEVLDGVFARIRARRDEPEPGSYVAALLAGGPDRVLKKVGEEATEVVLAALGGDREALVRETADLWFHTLVTLAAAGVEPRAVWAELQARAGRGGAPTAGGSGPG